MNNITINVTQEFYYYDSATENNGNPENRSSGAYIFRPSNYSNTTGNLITENVEITLIQDTSDVVEVHQRFGNFVKQIIRINKYDQPYIEFDWLIGPIEV